MSADANVFEAIQYRCVTNVVLMSSCIPNKYLLDWEREIGKKQRQKERRQLKYQLLFQKSWPCRAAAINYSRAHWGLRKGLRVCRSFFLMLCVSVAVNRIEHTFFSLYKTHRSALWTCDGIILTLWSSIAVSDSVQLLSLGINVTAYEYLGNVRLYLSKCDNFTILIYRPL